MARVVPGFVACPGPEPSGAGAGVFEARAADRNCQPNGVALFRWSEKPEARLVRMCRLATEIPAPARRGRLRMLTHPALHRRRRRSRDRAELRGDSALPCPVA